MNQSEPCAAAGGMCRRKVFISYAHADAEWKDRFQTMLAPATGGNLEIWSDEQIEVGNDWRVTIERELAAASIALLLVSEHFLASEFVRQVELPQLLARHAAAGMKLYWVPLRPALFDQSPFVGLQSPWSVKEPLFGLPAAAQAAGIRDICARLVEDAGTLVRLNEVRHNRMQMAVQAAAQRWNIRIDRLLGSGSAAVSYLGTTDRKQVVVKALIDTPARGQLLGLADELERVRTLRHASFSRLEHTMLDTDPPCLVLEYVDASPVADALRDQPFDADTVLAMIGDLARALQEYHGAGLLYGPMVVDDIFIDQVNGRLRLPAISLASRFAIGNLVNAGFPRNLRAATYLAPETYRGEPYTTRTDQYALALLAVEMLLGQPPVIVRCAADIALKAQFFDHPAATCRAALAQLHPGLAELLLRLLHADPAERFDDMSALAVAMALLEPAAQSLATQSYVDHCMNKPAFYADFYARFFARSQRAATLFQGQDLARQYQMLESALQVLLNYAPGNRIDAKRLQAVAAVKGHRGVSALELAQFRDSLLDALREHANEPPAVLEAWRTVLRPGLAFLGAQMGGNGGAAAA